MKKVSILTFAGISLTAIASCLILNTNAQAQVVYSLGITEVYDDNIFLEDKNSANRTIVDSPDFDPSLRVPVQIDGKKNDDFITQVFFSASGALPVQPNFTGSLGGTIGALVFAEETGESRLTLDFDLSLAVAEGRLPEHLGLAFDSSLTSGSNSIRTAQGTSARSSENLQNSLTVSYDGVQVAPTTTFGANYAFSRYDFLGEFLFSEDEDRKLSPLAEERGADYFTNALNTTLDKQFTQAFTGGINLGVTNYIFTSVESSGIEPAEDPDRTDFSAALTSSYVASRTLSLNSSVGVILSRLKDEPEPVTVTTVGADGVSTTTIEAQDRDNTSLAFDVGLNYLPQAGTTLNTSVSQTVGTDIDGKRTLVRTVALNGAQDLGERLGITLGAAFVQFDENQNLGNSSDRFEISSALTYSITESISLAIGYNYANQKTDNEDQVLSFGTNDYKVNRAFISLSGGLVGLTN